MTSLKLAPVPPSPSAPSALLDELRPELEGLDEGELLRWALDRFGTRAAVATSFGPEGMLLLQRVAELKRETGRQLRVFTIDTGRLPEETYQLLDRTRLSLGLDVEVYAPIGTEVEQLVAEKGPYSFYESIEERKRCCAIRKVEPLRRALGELDLWIVGLRREQAPSRNDLDLLEVDAANRGILKMSPLIEWSEQEVWSAVAERRTPVSKLHEQGYPSVGCAPCSRPVPGWVRGGDNSDVDIRAGRWWWESPEHKECGLHQHATEPAQPAGGV